MTQERMKLIAFNSARELVLNYNTSDLKAKSSTELLALCDKSVVIRAAKQSQINVIIDNAAYDIIVSNEQFIATLETQVQSLLSNKKIY